MYTKNYETYTTAYDKVTRMDLYLKLNEGFSQFIPFVVESAINAPIILWSFFEIYRI